MAIPDWVVFPGTTWQEMSLAEAGFRPELSTSLASYTPRPGSFYEDHTPDQFAGVLTRGGYIVRRWGRTTDYQWQTASVGKAFTRAALGLAADRLGLNVNDPVSHTWTGVGRLSHPHKDFDNDIHKTITWRHLVEHQAGFGIENGFEWRQGPPPEAWRAAKWTGNPIWDMISFRDTRAYFYSSANFVRLGQALTALWGLDLKTVLDQELFSKIGIPADRWSWMSLRDVYQNFRMYPRMPGYGHYADEPHEINGVVVRGGPGWVLMSAEDLARFGLLVATGGIWNGKQLLSPEWLISKSGGNGSSAFGDPATYVAGSWVTTEGMPPYLFVPDSEHNDPYTFPSQYIDNAVIPGVGRQTGTTTTAFVFGINDTNGALTETHWNGTAWQKTVVDANANLSRASVVFYERGPRVYGIRRDNQVLYEAYWDGARWKSSVLDANASLTDLSAILDSTSNPQVFGIRAGNRSLYQAYRGLEWQFRILMADADLSSLDAVHPTDGPQVFGARAGTGALYQAYWWINEWRKRDLDANAGLQRVAAVLNTTTNTPHVFGIRTGGALYEAFYNGTAWVFNIIDASAGLSTIAPVFDAQGGVTRVFGIRANTKALYQATKTTTWSFSDIDSSADLVDIAAGSEANRVFGIRATNKALYHAFWNGTQWQPATIDANANFSRLDAAYGTLKTYGFP